MSSERYDIRIDASPEEVWAVVSDSTRVPEWFPPAERCTVEGSVRTVVVTGGSPVVEEIVTNDPVLRRFQYSIVEGGPPRDYHLATVDVLDEGSGSRVIFSIESRPDPTEERKSFIPVVLQTLKALLEH